MSTATENSVLKLSPRNKPSDYIHWRRHLYVFIRKDDPELLGLCPRPEDSSLEKICSWFKKANKTKSLPVLSLGYDAISQTRKIIDDDNQTAKDLWEELNRVYTTTSGQAIQNLRQKLDALLYDDTKDWDAHVSAFLKICEELATYDDEVTEAEKTSKLIRSLPQSFSPLSMVSTITSTTFEKVVSAVEAEISRRANPNNPHKDGKQPLVKAANVAARTPSRGRVLARGSYRGNRSRQSDKGRSGQFHRTNSQLLCHYCGRPGYFISVCRSRMADENSGRVTKPHRGGHAHYGQRRRGTPFRPQTRNKFIEVHTNRYLRRAFLAPIIIGVTKIPQTKKPNAKLILLPYVMLRLTILKHTTAQTQQHWKNIPHSLAQ